MNKRLLSLFVVLLLCLCATAFAAAKTDTPLQDPEAFSNGVAEHLYNQDKGTHLHKQYKVSRSKMEAFIQAYVDYLKLDPSMKYLGVTQNGKHIYHCFAPAKGYSYDTFAVKSYGKKITPTICLAVQYEENDTKAYLRYSYDFYIKDLGARIDMDVFPTPKPTKVPTPKPTAKPTLAPTPTPVGGMSGYGYVTTNSVNLRTGPGTSYRALRFMHRYAFARVLETVQSNGATWYKIVQNGDTGYVMGTYFQQLAANELTAFLLSDKYLQGIQNNIQATATPRVTATPYYYVPPVYVPTRAPNYYYPQATATPKPYYPPTTATPAVGQQPIYLNIQDPVTYTNNAISYQYSFNGGAYKQHCYRRVSGNAQTLAASYVNMLRTYETTLQYGGVYHSSDGTWTYHYFTSPYAYQTFTVYYDSQPVAPASCLVIGHSADRVYLYFCPNFSVQDEGRRM